MTTPKFIERAREEGLSLNSLLARLADEYLFNREEY